MFGQMRFFTLTIPFSKQWIPFLVWTALSAICVDSYLLGADRVRLACGSEEGVNEAFRNISARATAFRDDIKCRIEWNGSQGAAGLVKQIIFDDGVEWAVKVVDSTTFHRDKEGFQSLEMIEKYCPELPVPKQFGEGGTLSLANGSLTYFFMEWLDGRELSVECQFRNSSDEK